MTAYQLGYLIGKFIHDFGMAAIAVRLFYQFRETVKL